MERLLHGEAAYADVLLTCLADDSWVGIPYLYEQIAALEFQGVVFLVLDDIIKCILDQ